MPLQHPRWQTKSLLESLDVRPSDVNKKVRKQLVYLQSVDNSVWLAASANSYTKGTIICQLSASMNSSRQQISFSSHLSSHHRRIAAVTETTTELPQTRREPVRRAAFVGLVVNYLFRDEQSRMNPGKRDCVTVNGEKVQTCLYRLHGYLVQPFQGWVLLRFTESIHSRLSRNPISEAFNNLKALFS